MELYDIVECLVTFAIAVIGFIMFAFPNKSTKKEKREDEKAVASTKKSGLILMIVGVVATIVMVVINLK